MSNNDAPLSREQMKQFEAGIKEPYKEHEDEKRRSLEISSGFLDKLAALSAGSMAASASITLAIVVRSDVHSGATRTVIHDLLLIVGFLWASLMLAILHNFLAAQVAKLDAAISASQFQWTLMSHTLSLTKETMPTIDDATMERAENLLREKASPKESRHVKWRELLYPTVNWIGRFAMLTFVIAFTLVMFYLHQLW
jgi:hypothetical protein